MRTLAAQLATALPAYKAAIDAEPALQEQFERALTDPGSAVERAVLAPLAGLPAPEAARLIVIDALDEALELDAEEAHHGTIVSLLASKAVRFPSWLRLLATARPMPDVRDALDAFGVKPIDAESGDNRQDLRRYVLTRAAREPLAACLRDSGDSAEEVAQLLVDRSAGKFLYAARAMRDIENGRIGVANWQPCRPAWTAFIAIPSSDALRGQGKTTSAPAACSACSLPPASR